MMIWLTILGIVIFGLLCFVTFWEAESKYKIPYFIFSILLMIAFIASYSVKEVAKTKRIVLYELYKSEKVNIVQIGNDDPLIKYELKDKTIKKLYDYLMIGINQ
jgi:hypothetical protein